MYENFFGFKEHPFSLTPNSDFFFFSRTHSEAYHHILYALKRREGFMALTGEVGLGKTTLVRRLLHEIGEEMPVAVILHPNLTIIELFRTICDDLEIDTFNCNIKSDYLSQLHKFLLERGSTVIIIDEAQNLSWELFEELRLLSNLETEKQKLLQLILVGQPELKEKLSHRNLRQLRQRLSCRYNLEPFNLATTEQYINHRLSKANPDRFPQFHSDTLRLIHRLSGGAPRKINILCDRALLAAFTHDAATVTVPMALEAIESVEGHRLPLWKRIWHANSHDRTKLTVIFVVFMLIIAGVFRISYSPYKAESEHLSNNELLMNNYPKNKSILTNNVQKPTQTPVAVQLNRCVWCYLMVQNWLERSTENKSFSELAEKVKYDGLKMIDNDIDLFSDKACDAIKANLSPKYTLTTLASPLLMLQIPYPAVIEDKETGNCQIVLHGRDSTLLAYNQDNLAGIKLEHKRLSEMPNFVTIVWQDRLAIEDYTQLYRKGVGIQKLISALKQTGYLDEDYSTRSYNARLKSAVSDFQRIHQLPVDGYFGLQTHLVMNRLLELN